ncbi:hypothetical protein [Clostridium sp. Marseille-P2415]|uniref:hypothetical protein n=1 Tax=Clostridium sp. Marseille-P2415 TaxID=1805471 RepID=UPI001F2EE91B|nr:hypothetical protein [Clostridium sp. Marseille-P2415]
MGETERIKHLVAYYTKILKTRDPFKIADQLGVLYQIGNCYFIRNKTLLLNSKFERRANTFAAYLLIDDNLLFGFKELPGNSSVIVRDTLKN